MDIDLKIPPRPPGYAFVEVFTIRALVKDLTGFVSLIFTKSLFLMQFEDPRDADDAIYGRDGYDFDGCRLRVRNFTYLLSVFLSFGVRVEYQDDCFLWYF